MHTHRSREREAARAAHFFRFREFNARKEKANELGSPFLLSIGHSGVAFSCVKILNTWSSFENFQKIRNIRETPKY